MKICFLLQRNFAYIGHNLAILLKKKYGIKDFCAYVYLRPSYNFLRSQNDVDYSALLLDEEIHKQYTKEKLDLNYIKWLEKEYGIPNLWPYITLDRVVMFNQPVREYPYDVSPYTHEEMLRIVQVKAKAVIAFLKEEKPDIFFYSAIGGIGSLLMYHVAKKMGIKTLAILPACTENKYVLSEKYDSFTGAEKVSAERSFNPNDLKQARLFLDQFRAKPAPYYKEFVPARQAVLRRQQFQFLRPNKIKRSIAAVFANFYNYSIGNYQKDYTTIHPWDYLKDRIKRKIRNLYNIKKLYDQIDFNEDYAYFPLQAEPEVALLLQAPFVTSQINMIHYVARSLPAHFKLYVKEHPQMVSFRAPSYYQQIKKIPNVKLIDPALLGFPIIKHAKLITAITDTTGWEATLLQKPVITFGNIFYNFLPMVKRCREIEQLPYLVKEQLENFNYQEEKLLDFLASIFSDSIAVDLIQAWEQNTDGNKKQTMLEPLADFLAEKLGLTASRSNL